MDWRTVTGPPSRPGRGTHRSITLDVAAADLVAANSTTVLTPVCAYGGRAVAVALIRNTLTTRLNCPRFPARPPHEITRDPSCAGELAAFAASCRNGLMTLSKAQS